MLYWRTVEPSLLMPAFVDDLLDLLGPDQSEWYVTWGFRSIAESDVMYAAWKAGTGPRAAPGGKSPHNFGLAVDLALDGDPHRPRLQPEWNEQHPDWIRLRAKVDQHPRLHGGWWFGDGDHVEVVNWQQFKNWAASVPAIA